MADLKGFASESGLLVNLASLMTRPTGISTYALNLLPHLQALDPTLLTAQPLPAYRCYPTPAKLTAEQGIQGHLKRLVWTETDLPKISQQLKAKLLFSPLPEAPLLSPSRYVVMVHDLIPLKLPNLRSPLTLYNRFLVPRILENALHILCNSTATADDLTQLLKIPAGKITPILLAYDQQHFQWLDLPTDQYFLYLGRHAPHKNLSRLIAAFASVAQDQDSQLWLAGEPDRRYTPRLKAQIASLGLTSQVKFLDYIAYADLPRLINQAIALVFPSLWEGFGLPVLEAMACGTPVITSNLSSLPEVAGEAALLVNPDQVDELAEAMRMIVNDAGLRSQLRQAGLRRAKQFSWAKTGQATVELIKQYL
jgi:glycosyltransferase involved in cell wall biosynthesis